VDCGALYGGRSDWLADGVCDFDDWAMIMRLNLKFTGRELGSLEVLKSPWIWDSLLSWRFANKGFKKTSAFKFTR